MHREPVPTRPRPEVIISIQVLSSFIGTVCYCQCTHLYPTYIPSDGTILLEYIYGSDASLRWIRYALYKIKKEMEVEGAGEERGLAEQLFLDRQFFEMFFCRQALGPFKKISALNNRCS